jgi:hypothetical protein
MALRLLKRKSNIPATSIDDTNLFLNNMVSEDDRKTLICTKLQSYFKTCGNSSCSIFQDMMPNLN